MGTGLEGHSKVRIKVGLGNVRPAMVVLGSARTGSAWRGFWYGNARQAAAGRCSALSGMDRLAQAR